MWTGGFSGLSSCISKISLLVLMQLMVAVRFYGYCFLNLYKINIWRSKFSIKAPLDKVCYKHRSTLPSPMDNVEGVMTCNESRYRIQPCQLGQLETWIWEMLNSFISSVYLEIVLMNEPRRTSRSFVFISTQADVVLLLLKTLRYVCFYSWSV